MNRNEHVPPNWIAVKIDESEHCDREFLARCGGKVFQIYLVDTSIQTHCCELTPSYGMVPIDLVAESYPDDEQARETLYEDLMDASNVAEFCYRHCRHVDRLPDDHKVDLGLALDPEDWQDDPDRGEDFAREEYQGGQRF